MGKVSVGYATDIRCTMTILLACATYSSSTDTYRHFNVFERLEIMREAHSYNE